MKFPYKVKDLKSIQRNFDYAATRFGSLVETKTVGPITGNNGSVSTGGGLWVAVGMAITYKTGATSVRARIDEQLRVQGSIATWSYCFLGLNVSPAPLSRLHSNAVAGASAGGSVAPNGSECMGLVWVSSTALIAASLVGFDTMVLAPNTSYTFTAMLGGGGAAGAVFWNSDSENFMMGTFTVED